MTFFECWLVFQVHQQQRLSIEHLLFVGILLYIARHDLHSHLYPLASNLQLPTVYGSETATSKRKVSSSILLFFVLRVYLNVEIADRFVDGLHGLHTYYQLM